MSRTASWLAFGPVFVLGALASGCGGAAGVHGTIGGKSFSGSSAVSARQSQVGEVIISSGSDDLCALITADAPPTNSQILTIQLFEVDANGTYGTAVDIGKYVLATDDNTNPAGQFAVASLTQVGAQASDQSSVPCTGGSITLDKPDAASAYRGSVDLTFGSDHLQGSFEGSFCAALASL